MHNNGFNQITRAVFNLVVVGFNKLSKKVSNIMSPT